MHILILTLVLCLNQFGHIVTLNITGGPYQQHRYMNTHVILAHQVIGPKMCVEECMLYNGCNAVNFKRNVLTCELLTLAYTGAQPTNSNGIYYTAIDTWSKVSLPFHYHFLLKWLFESLESEQSYIWMFEVSILLPSTIFLLEIGTLPTVWYALFFILLAQKNKKMLSK